MVNFFDKIKPTTPPKQEKTIKTIPCIYFDCETYEYYENEEQKDPYIIPYLVGAVDNITKQFKYFFGPNAANPFIKWVLGDKTCKDSLSEIEVQSWRFNKRWKKFDEPRWKTTTRPLNQRCKLVAFNIGYDFHSCRPWWEALYKENLNMDYMMSEDRDFVFGRIETDSPLFKNKSSIYLLDLWMWDRTMSLDKSMTKIKGIIWDGDNVKSDPESIELYHEITSYGLDKDSFKKGSLKYYKKVNLYKEGNKYFFWASREDWINKLPPIELNIKDELEYLKVDVLSMPVIHKQQLLSRKLLLSAVGIKIPLDEDVSITLPGFAKYIFEEYQKEYMQQSYRCKVSVEDYQEMLDSYSGAFTASNPSMTYLDEDVFKKLYPGKSYYDKNGDPIIKCYDVNSMYPYIMSNGVPKYIPSFFKPDGEYITWYEIIFDGYIDKENKLVYKWKDKYSCFNNSFFGDSFIKQPHEMEVKVYILDKLYDLFISMCDSNVRIINKRYQIMETKSINIFINKLYKIKENKDKLYTPFQVSEVKLLMNSLYGKFGEKFRTNKVIWTTNIQKYIDEVVSKYEGEELDKILGKQVVYKNENMGFVRVPNTEKTVDSAGIPCRENILAGCYVTQTARHILLSTIKEEIDQGNVFLNCDTDSFKLLQFNDVKFKVHESELGAWKYEGCFTHFGHPNKLKKYWLININLDDPKKNFKLATAGIPKNSLINRDKYSLEECVEILKTIYDENNKIVVKDAKNICRWSKHSHQPIIYKTDIDIIGGMKKEYTHEIVNGVITCLT